MPKGSLLWERRGQRRGSPKGARCLWPGNELDGANAVLCCSETGTMRWATARPYGSQSGRYAYTRRPPPARQPSGSSLGSSALASPNIEHAPGRVGIPSWTTCVRHGLVNRFSPSWPLPPLERADPQFNLSRRVYPSQVASRSTLPSLHLSVPSGTLRDLQRNATQPLKAEFDH